MGTKLPNPKLRYLLTWMLITLKLLKCPNKLSHLVGTQARPPRWSIWDFRSHLMKQGRLRSTHLDHIESEEMTVEAGKEVPLRSGHQHWGRETVQFNGLPVQQKTTQLVRREHVHAALHEHEPSPCARQSFTHARLIALRMRKPLYCAHPQFTKMRPGQLKIKQNMQIYKLRDRWKSRNQSRQKKWNQKAMRKIWQTICSTAKKQRKHWNNKSKLIWEGLRDWIWK